MSEGTSSQAMNDQPKQVYEAPRVAESATFERLVLACGHRPTDLLDPGCNPLLGMGGVSSS